MEYKTLRYPGHAAAMRVVRELGLFSTDPVDVRGHAVAPRDLFFAAAGPRLRKDPRTNPDLVALRVDVIGDLNGQETTLRWDLLDRFDSRTGITAMMRTTGFSLSITGIMQAEGVIPAGAWTPDEIVPAEAYIEALAERGVNITHEEMSGRPAL
jgi:lysine 6-dehydrogenase